MFHRKTFILFNFFFFFRRYMDMYGSLRHISPNLKVMFGPSLTFLSFTFTCKCY